MAEFTYASFDQDRTAGRHAGQYKSVQSWKSAKVKTQNTAPPSNNFSAAQKEILNNLEQAKLGKVDGMPSSNTAIAYAAVGQPATAPQAEPDFQFSDVIDVINPLHHLPIVGSVYRGLTGDELHPMSQIIGGALYGGPIGAITGTANAVSQIQTGKDLTGLVLSKAGFGNKDTSIDKNNPEQQLGQIAQTMESNQPLDKLPGSAIAFVNLSEPNNGYRNINIAEGRTAGKMIVRKDYAAYQNVGQQRRDIIAPPPAPNLDSLPPVDKITSLAVSALPPRQRGI